MITQLSASTPEKIEILGGKGCGLVRLLRTGLPVPPAWCIPATLYEEDGAGQASLPESVIKELEKFWQARVAEDAGSLFAVRSSATAEDLDEASFAGVYTTHLGIGSAEALAEAIRDCWSALQSEGARAYREEKKIGHDVRIAVILQRMVQPDVAGVMLTANPRRAFANELVIDAAWGLGEGIVSGKTQPDHLILDRRTGKIREEIPGTKEIAVRYRQGEGLVDEKTAPELRKRRSLTESQLTQLFVLSDTITKNIGPRQDLEWAFEGDRLFVLQQRPITGLPPENPSNVWSRKFGDEYLADYNMPLSHSLLTHWISDVYLREIAVLMKRKDLAGIESIRRYEGYAYFSGQYMARMLRAVPPASRTMESVPWFPPLWEKRITAEPYEPWRMAGMLSAPLRDPEHGPLHKNYGALKKHCANVEREIAPKLFQDYSALATEQWRAQFKKVDEFGRDHFRVIRWGMGFYNPVLHGMLKGTLARLAGDASGELYASLVSGLPGTRTAEINRDIWKLGITARSEAGVRKALLEHVSLEEARARTEGAAFWKEFDDFVRRHGHRAATREVAQPRWRETPEILLGFVRAQLHMETPPQDPAMMEADAIARRRAAEREALALAKGPVRRGLLRRLFKTTQIFTRYRENQRYHLDYILQHTRNLLVEQGRRMVKAGVLKDAHDVFLLEAAEFWPLVDNPVGSPEIDALIEERRRHYLRWKDRLPATYLFDDVETEGEIVEGDPNPGTARAGGEGVGASRGKARGKVRVIRELAHLDEIRPGEILVASNIDPGWTNVFPLISGLVTETGGLLSHGALLAREYGIPAVMGVQGATKRYATGAVLEIDGSSGEIRLEAESARPS